MNPVIINAKSLTLSTGQGIDSKLLNSFSSATGIDLATLTDAINNYLVPAINGLPNLADESIDPIANTKLDGSQLFVDNDASTLSDSGLFYDPAAADGSGGFGRPITIREALLVIAQLISKNLGTNYTEYTEAITVSAGDVSNGYLQLSDPLGIINASTKFKVYYSTGGTDAVRLVGSPASTPKYTVDTGAKQISPANGFTLVQNDIFLIDYNYTNVILP